MKITFRNQLLPVVLLISVANLPLGAQEKKPIACPDQTIPATKLTSATKTKKGGQEKWTKLFDGKTLKGWKVTKYGGEGEVTAKDGLLTVDMGNPLSGVTSTHKDLPKINYEMRLEAQRVLGSDFFCGLTFPVKKESCSLILGGWGGGVIGLSSLDGYDAAENETTDYRAFKSKKWYKVRLRVTEKKILAWLDGESIVDVDLSDKKVSVRIEVELSKPLGLSTFETTAAFRNVEMRPLTSEEVKSTNEKK